MIIIAHRGYWKEPSEKNSIVAFKRALEKGFGIETDVRDFQGELVISHDIPNKDKQKFESFLDVYKQSNHVTLAVNIKADGLQNLLQDLLESNSIKDYFVFDMAVPDGLVYLSKGLSVFTRQSEYEIKPSFYDEAKGVWLDAFQSDWVDEITINQHLMNNKQVCIVSPELHKRPYLDFWKRLSSIRDIDSHDIMLCTDFPEEAKRFFNEEN